MIRNLLISLKPDDEKYLLQRDVKKQADMMKKIKAKNPIDLLKHYQAMGQDNIRDIIACGFLPEKTFIFSDLDYLGCVLLLLSRLNLMRCVAVRSIATSCLLAKP